MTNAPRRIYLFRSEQIVNGSDTVVCAAPVDLVVEAFGGGDDHGQEGVRQAFGGNAFYRNVETGECFIGVWGTRNASRFRTALRRHATIEIARQPPPARLVWWYVIQPRPRPLGNKAGTDASSG